jgi:hypothetical protein
VLEPGNLVEARVKVGPPPKSSRKAPAPDGTPAAESFWSTGLWKLKAFALGRK